LNLSEDERAPLGEGSVSTCKVVGAGWGRRRYRGGYELGFVRWRECDSRLRRALFRPGFGGMHSPSAPAEHERGP